MQGLESETQTRILLLGRKEMLRLDVFVRVLSFSRVSVSLLSYHIERDSPRDQFVVTLFLLTVFGLLLGAGIKGKLLKAGIDVNRSWSPQGKWWEVC